MIYEMEELVPIVAKLAQEYTKDESTSIPYEKAEQLMGAVLYCIHELEETHEYALVSNEKMPAQRAYELGVGYVEEKTKKALKLYNEIIPEFCHYDNQCLYDTFTTDILNFFKKYDIQFKPQETIHCLDYPILKDISAYKGIDQIYEFVQAICLEQKFLKLFPKGYIIDILSKHNSDWKQSVDNICEIVLVYVIGHILAGKSLTEEELNEADYSYILGVFMQTDLVNIKNRLEEALQSIVNNYYGNDRELFQYLSGAISNIVVRLKNAADNNVLGNII